ncbi:hypothetical protein acdb102_11820 [Acidothermaceae bacterium B102]|nr:hypothetical protein acdb102_11820 [Acidothermaceae bacterium B102]
MEVDQQGAPATEPTPAEALAADLDRMRAALRVLPAAEHSHALRRLAEVAARLLQSDSGQVSILTSEQVAAATGGLARDYAGTTVALTEAFCTITTVTSAPVVIPDASADDRVRHLSLVRSGQIGSYLGVPLTLTAGPTIGALCVYGTQPHQWTAPDVALLTHLGSTVVAELELAALTQEYDASRLNWELAVDAAGIGSFDWDLRTDRVDWDARLAALHGFDPSTEVPTSAEALRHVHADDRARLDAHIADALATGNDLRTEYRVVWPDGSTHWLALRGRRLQDAGGTPARLIGSAYDMTEVRTAKDEASDILATMTTGFLSLGRDWRVTYVNAAGELLLERTSAELLGRSMWEAFPGLDEIEFGRQYRRAVATNLPVEFEAYYPHNGRWYEVRAVPGPAGLALYFLDISERRGAQERAEVSAARLELLSTVSAELSGTLVVDALTDRLAKVVVPALGDWCVVTLAEATGPRDVASWHHDPGQRPLVERYAALRLAAMKQHSLLFRGTRPEEAEVLPYRLQAEANEVMVAGEARDLLAELGAASAALLPLRSRERTVGQLTIYRHADRPAMTDADVAVATEVASRAAVALDNAMMYADQRGRAEALQRSLLTDPPHVDGLEIVGRYVAAAETASVGGDWFDAFRQPGGATVLVIGDVVGHDTEAAAAMGQLRGLLRGIAWQSGGGPAAVLSRLDAAIEGLQLPTTATAVVAQLDAIPTSRGTMTLRWSNAGHPPPMAIHPDGGTLVLNGPEADLLLGVAPDTARSMHEIDLVPGATVLMYTDGLIERRGPGLDEGLARLERLLAELATLPLATLCDVLLQRLVPDRPDDDVAIVAVRLEPRHAQAGASARTEGFAAAD